MIITSQEAAWLSWARIEGEPRILLRVVRESSGLRYLILGANAAADAASRLSYEERVGRYTLDAFPESGPLLEVYHQVVETGTARTLGEFTYEDPDHPPQTFEVRVVPLGPDHLIIAYRSLTQLRETEQRMLEATRVATWTLAGALAHELNNPLMSIRAGVEFLAEDAALGQPVSAADVAVIRQAIVQATALTQRMREMAQTDSAQRVDVSELCTHTVEALRPMVLRDSLAELTCEAGPPLFVQADAARVRHILSALVQAAVAGLVEEPGWISVNPLRLEGLVGFRVRDTGPGLSPERRRTLFDPFLSAESGAQLELSVARGIAESLGGELRLEETTTGTSFLVLLPEAP